MKNNLISFHRYKETAAQQENGKENEKIQVDLKKLQFLIDLAIKELDKYLTYIPKPDMLTQKAKFIEIAEYISKDFQIDMDILEFDTQVNVYFHCEYKYYNNQITAAFKQLLAIADNFTICPPMDENDDITILITYETHIMCNIF